MIRLTHILAAMALILLVGVLSVRHLEERLGTTSVPGLVVVECPGWGADVLDALRVRWAGATLEWIEGGEEPFAPFGAGYVRPARDRGEAVALFASGAVDRASPSASVWPVVLDAFPGGEPTARAREATAAAARFTAGRTGSRGFVVGVALPPDLPPAAAPSHLEPLLAALESFPAGRRTTLVVLGAREEEVVAGQADRRWCLRIPRGDWGRLIRPGFEDLLERASGSAGPW